MQVSDSERISWASLDEAAIDAETFLTGHDSSPGNAQVISACKLICEASAQAQRRLQGAEPVDAPLGTVRYYAAGSQWALVALRDSVTEAAGDIDRCLVDLVDPAASLPDLMRARDLVRSALTRINSVVPLETDEQREARHAHLHELAMTYLRARPVDRAASVESGATLV